ncbi:MAG: TRAP transporter small permease [Burkholderiaceae bacterium]
MQTASNPSSGPGPARAGAWLADTPARLLGGFACFALFLMMIVTFIDVTGRYVFNSPLPAAYELISLNMLFIIFCAMPSVNLRSEHVTIDLLDGFVPASFKLWQHRLVNLVCMVAMGLMAWRLAVRSHDHYRFNEATDELFLPVWPFSMIMALLSVVSMLTFLVLAFRAPVPNPSVESRAT